MQCVFLRLLGNSFFGKRVGTDLVPSLKLYSIQILFIN